MWRTRARNVLGPERVDVDDVLEAPPDRADGVARLGEAQALAPREQAASPRGVHEPARADARLAPLVAHLEGVRRALLSRARLPRTLAPRRTWTPSRWFSSSRSASMRARLSWKAGWKGRLSVPISLISCSGRCAALVVEEVAQAVLRQLVLVEVAGETQPADQIVRRDLDGRLADLVRSARSSARRDRSAAREACGAAGGRADSPPARRPGWRRRARATRRAAGRRAITGCLRSPRAPGR